MSFIQVFLKYIQPISSEDFLIYLGVLIGFVAFSYYFYRWIFSVNRITRELTATRKLLSKIAERQGVSGEDIESIQKEAESGSW